MMETENQPAGFSAATVVRPGECRCDFAQKMQGDGCEVCNPERAEDFRDEWPGGTSDIELMPVSELSAELGLLSCPFCGGSPINDKTLRDGYESGSDDLDAYAYFIRCNSCAAHGGWAKTSAGAKRCWNMRT
jgi:Lar family restriction alleviation protein